MSDTPTKTQLNKLKVAELRGQLTELGLATNGIKADLVQRLFTHYQEQEAEAEQAVEESQEEKAPSPAPEPADVVPDVEPAPPSESQSQNEVIETPTELEDKQTPAEVEDPVTPAEVEEAVTPAEVEESARPAEVEESVVEPETAMEVETVDEETPAPAAQSSLTVKVSAPVDHPAGPPPAEAEHSEEVDNSGEGAEDSVEYGQTNGDVERKDKSKKKNKKKKKKNRPEIWAREAQEAERRRKEEEERAEENEDVEVEYIQQELELDPLDPMYRTFSKIFANFKLVDPAEAKAMKEDEVSEDTCQMTEPSMMKF